MSSSPTSSASSMASTRILFRVSDGRTTMGEFPQTTTLAEIRQHAHKHLDLDPATTEVSKRMPACVLTSDIDESTLEDLGLVPTGTLLLCSREQRQKELEESEERRRREMEEKGLFLEDRWDLISPKTLAYVYAAMLAALVSALVLFFGFAAERSVKA